MNYTRIGGLTVIHSEGRVRPVATRHDWFNLNQSKHSLNLFAPHEKNQLFWSKPKRKPVGWSPTETRIGKPNVNFPSYCISWLIWKIITENAITDSSSSESESESESDYWFFIIWDLASSCYGSFSLLVGYDMLDLSALAMLEFLWDFNSKPGSILLIYFPLP